MLNLSQFSIAIVNADSMANWILCRFLDGGVPRYSSYDENISQLISFTRVYSDASNNRNKYVTTKFRKQGYRYPKKRKAFFSKFFRRLLELIVEYMLVWKLFCSMMKVYLSQYYMVILLILVWKLFCSMMKVYLSQYNMVILLINSNDPLKGLLFL